jgi:hypothetical protein
MKSSRLFLGAGGFQARFRTRNSFVARCYGKVDIACQAIAGRESRKAAKRCGLEAPVSLENASAFWTGFMES